MPTSPRGLTGGSGQNIQENLPLSYRTLGTMRASSPTRAGNFPIHPTPFFAFRGPLHTRRKRGHPRKAQRAGDFSALALWVRFPVPAEALPKALAKAQSDKGRSFHENTIHCHPPQAEGHQLRKVGVFVHPALLYHLLHLRSGSSAADHLQQLLRELPGGPEAGGTQLCRYSQLRQALHSG